MDDLGWCSGCGGEFHYQIIHNGFNDSAYAYCDQCGSTAILSGWSDRIPPGADLKLHGPVQEHIEPLLKPCRCGGRFRAHAAPRCPKCNNTLSAEQAREFIQRDAPGTARGWRWQGTWDGLYCIIVEGNVVEDPWRSDEQ